MRVIAGELGGRRLAAPPGRGTRPTADRVKEALFSILGDAVEGARVLDLFAGSGALGIEALSRGAAHADLVDFDRRAIKVLRQNVSDLDLALRTRIHQADASMYLRRALGPWDLVLLDPPYSLGLPWLEARLKPRLAPGALVVVESGRRPVVTLGLPLRVERRYGDTLLRVHGV